MDEGKKLTLTAHLDELRSRIIKCLICIILMTCLIYVFTNPILSVLAKPVGRLVFLSPQEAFVTSIKVAFLGGAFLSSPVIIYQVWRFISSALTKNEKKHMIIFAPLSLAFFVSGSAFGYFIIIPIGLKFLLGFATDFLIPTISISNYVSFIGVMVLSFGLIFELPLASLFLTKLKVVTPRFLSTKRKHAVVIVFIVAAILTPPDVITQCLMAVPLLILYEIGIIFSKVAYKGAG